MSASAKASLPSSATRSENAPPNSTFNNSAIYLHPWGHFMSFFITQNNSVKGESIRYGHYFCPQEFPGAALYLRVDHFHQHGDPVDTPI